MVATAYTIFLLNFFFGIAAASGVLRGRRLRPVHHLFYLLAILSLAAAGAAAFVTEEQNAWALSGMVLLLLAMPTFRGGSRRHRIYALFCLGCYTAVLLI